MRKLLNTLYITQSDLTIGRDGTNVVIYRNSEKLGQFPIQYFDNIICFNYTGMSPAAMALCVESNVSVSFLSPTGKFLAQLKGQVSGNVLLRRDQFRWADDPEQALELAKTFVSSKIFNSVKVLERGIHDHGRADERGDLKAIKSSLISSAREIVPLVKDMDTLLGVEGDASRTYFKGFRQLILNQDDVGIFKFSERNRRPPTDPVNAMLSFSYGMIRVLMQSALNTVGLDPFVGFYHQDRPGRSGLALDMMEELRAFMGDRFVLNLINLRQIDIQDFYFKDNGACLFSEDGIKKYLDLWNKRLQDEIKHPFLEETIPIGLIPYVQAMLLARHIRGDLNKYPPFLPF